MGKCVFCGNLSNNKKKATLHKFPRNEQLRKDWLKLIGFEGLSIQSSTFLCSDHFTEDCFVVHFNNRKCLKPGRMPTILKKEARFEKQCAQDVSVKTNCIDKFQNVVTISDKENCGLRRNVLMEINCIDNDIEPSLIIEQVPEASTIVEYSDSPTSKEILNQEKWFSLPSTPKNTDSLKKKYQPLTAHGKVLHDHHYEDTLPGMRRKLNNLRRKLDLKIKENRILKQTIGRMRKKIHSL